MAAYRIMWDSLKETAEHMVKIGNILETNEVDNNLSWSTLLDMMKEGEEVCEANKWYNGRKIGVDVPITIASAIEFGFACLGVLMLVLVFMGRIAYVG